MDLPPPLPQPHPSTIGALRSAVLSVAALAVVAVSSASEEGEGPLSTFQRDIEPLLDRYCYDCHGYGSDKGGVVLDGFSSDAEIQDHTLWLRAFKNLRSEVMPPNDEAQPTPEQQAKIVKWIKDQVFQLDPQNPDPGSVTVRRLNRVEYRNTIRDLIGVDYDTSKEFPADDTGHGFDNNGDVLSISPMLLEKYLDAAQAIVAEAVPTQALVVAETPIAGSRFLADGESPESSPSWMRELSYYEAKTVTATFQVEHPGNYELVIDLHAAETYVDNQFDLNECRLIFKADGETLLDRKFVREGWQAFEYRFDRQWEAGPHELTFEIVPLTPDREQIRNLRFRLSEVVVRGPMDDAHWVQPERYAKFFPKPVPDSMAERSAYAREVLSNFAYKAFRRPVDELTLDRLAELAERAAAREDGTFESGVAQAMVAVLASPRFLFREESILPTSGGEKYPLIDEYALASRLSYFLWSTMPDDELMTLAEDGALRNDLQGQVKRMLRDEKAKDFVTNFTGQWLQARDITTVPIEEFDVWLRENPHPEIDEARSTYRTIRNIPEENRTEEQKVAMAEAREAFISVIRQDRPELTNDIREAMLAETELVFEHVLREDRSLLELIQSDYTFLNEELAKHYDIEGVVGEEMRKVALPPTSPRGGVLTQGTLLAVTSNPTRTSPVKRGVFILENILGMPPAPPPPDIPSLEDVASEEELRAMSLRETMALHAKKSQCRSCHSRMDPLGLALDNFNALGRWRDSEMNQPIDPSGQLITGEAFTDIRSLKDIIVQKRRKDFYHCIAEKLLTYALGRGLEYYDTGTLDQLTDRLEKSGGRPSELIMAIVESAPFQKTRPESSASPSAIAHSTAAEAPQNARSTAN